MSLTSVLLLGLNSEDAKMGVKPVHGDKTQQQDLKRRKYQHLESVRVRVRTRTRPPIAKLVV